MKRGVVVEHGEHQHTDVRVLPQDPLRGRSPAAPRHVQVHEHNVGRRLEGNLDCLFAVTCLADDLEPSRLEQGPQPRSEDGMVIGDEDTYLRHSRLRSTEERTPPWYRHRVAVL